MSHAETMELMNRISRQYGDNADLLPHDVGNMTEQQPHQTEHVIGQ